MAYCVQSDPPAVFAGSISKRTCEATGGRWTLDQAEASGWLQALLKPADPSQADGDALPETIEPHTDPCALAARWSIHLRLAVLLVRLAGRLEFPLQIISGFRTASKQEALGKKGRPTAPTKCSTHTWCPATGADLWPGVHPVTAVKARLGAEAVLVGLRWGGGGKVDPESGIPKDWNHVDLGPRCK